MPPRFVELIRVSGDAQEARDTPSDQRHALDRLRETRPGTLVERIDLGAVSGAADKRPDLERLFALAAARSFDEVRVRHLDRLTRHDDLRQRAEIFGRLLDARAVIVDGSGHVIDPATELGELDYTLQTWMSAKERRRILERTLAARKRLASEGSIQGRPPFGRTWDKKVKAWGTDPDAMALYRRLFEDVLAGKTLAEIAEALNAAGVSTARGKEWTPAHVSRLIRHRAATGKVTGWGRTFECPAVVDEATQKAACAVLKRNGQRAGPPGHHPALLRRLLVCGECGSRMWTQRGGRTGDVRTFYVCSTYRTADNEACRRWHSVPSVDEAVKAHVLEEVSRPVRLRRAAEHGAPTEDPHVAVREAESEIAKLEKEEERLARLMRRNLISERVATKQLQEIARLRNGAEVGLVTARARVDALERALKESADVRAKTERIARNLHRAGFDAWRDFLVAQFPQPACSIRLWASGRIRLDGLLSFGRQTG